MSIAEHFRDELNTDVLVLIDNIYRFVQAGAEVSGLLGQLPSRVGYQPSLGTEIAELEERICSTASGALTSIQAVYVPADDSPIRRRPMCSGICPRPSCCRASAPRRGLYPAVDPLDSGSKMLTPTTASARHLRVARAVRRTLAEYESLKDVIAMLGLEQLSVEDRRTVAIARRLERFLTQPFRATERFTTAKGRRVTLADTLEGCEKILSGAFNDRPERALFMIGPISDAEGAP